MTKLRRWVWFQLIRIADRVSPEDAFRFTGYSYTFVPRVGIVFHEDDRGCPIWSQNIGRDRAFRKEDGWATESTTTG